MFECINESNFTVNIISDVILRCYDYYSPVEAQ